MITLLGQAKVKKPRTRYMDKIIVVTFKLRGTEKEIERIKARIASLTACEEIVSMYIRMAKEEKERKRAEVNALGYEI